jgi:hypothetical protein
MLYLVSNDGELEQLDLLGDDKVRVAVRLVAEAAADPHTHTPGHQNVHHRPRACDVCLALKNAARVLTMSGH